MSPLRSLLLLVLFVAVLIALDPGSANAGFDWGGDCTSGSGEFAQYVPQSQLITVGEIPSGKAEVSIQLDAQADVDIQLIDVLTGTEIIAWPSGMLDGPSEECTTWQGVEYCYSGYNGDQTSNGQGNEWIAINGVTNRTLEMRAFGYEAGSADVDYSFETTPTCGEVGEGSFSQYIPYQATTTVGTIATLKVGVVVELNAAGGADVDVQLVDPANGTEIVAWPDGLLNGPDAQTVEYQGMTIEYSGYNGIDGDWGREQIAIVGQSTRELELRAFGYQAGNADVDYSWGEGVGDTCLGIATLPCDEGLFCKAVQVGVSDPAGECHTELWCQSDASAAGDCFNVMHPAIPGFFSCQDFRCSYNTCAAEQVDPGFHFVSTDPAQCAAIRIGCEEGEVPFSNACGCGCKDTL